jgi:hypothetical protein
VIGARTEPEGALARALAALLVLGALEGLARRYGPPAEYPSIAVNTIEPVGLPTARLLLDARLYSGAATLALLLRHYMTSDPAQRGMDSGKRAIAACQEIEAARARHMSACCRHTAWQLHERLGEPPVRKFTAALYFALGDLVRANGIVSGAHVPSLVALVDLVEVSAELAPLDPLLQAVWLYTLGETQLDVPDDLRFLLRAVVPEVNGAFKGADEGAKRALGMSYSDAYATAVLSYVTGVWGDEIFETGWYRILVKALELPPAWNEYRSGFVRLLEIYSLTQGPAARLPGSSVIAAFAGHPPVDRTDLREVATMALQHDGWTGRRAQVGRSIAYDSAFLIEPWRRGESAAEALAMVEAHRHAALEFWLAVIPPLTEEVDGRNRRNVAIEDRDIAAAYRALAYLGSLEEAPLYARIHGDGTGRRLVRTIEGDRLRTLMATDERRREWYERALRDWPDYAAARTAGPATLAEIGELLGIG